MLVLLRGEVVEAPVETAVGVATEDCATLLLLLALEAVAFTTVSPPVFLLPDDLPPLTAAFVFEFEVERPLLLASATDALSGLGEAFVVAGGGLDSFECAGGAGGMRQAVDDDGVPLPRGALADEEEDEKEAPTDLP